MSAPVANHRRRLLLVIGALGAGAAGYGTFRAAGLLGQGPEIPPAAIATLLETPMADTTNRPQSLAAYRGRVLVVNFWATWCPPCRKEMPAFSRLQQKHAARGVQFVGIAIDSPPAVKEYALQTPVSYPLLLGGSVGVELMKKLGNPTAALPYTLVLDRQGAPALSHLGMVTEEMLEEKLLPLLAGG